jgi:zinc transport system substrate-binding protein
MFKISGPLQYKILYLVFLLLIAPLNASYAGQKLRVVASIAPLADFARQVGREKVDVILLLPPGASPHTFEPSPKTVQEISKARIFIKIGAGLEFWADRLISATTKDIITVRGSEGVDLFTETDHDHGRDRIKGVDPHIWLDPIICVNIIKKIQAAFSAADRMNSPYYEKNAASYIARLEALDKEISEKVRTFRTREYVTFHPAWNYFSKRYGLRVAGVIEESPGREPAPKHIGRILAEIRKMNARVVFAEPQFSPRIAEAIAREAGGKVLFLDPVGGQKNRETYIELMRYNISEMEKAMK